MIAFTPLIALHSDTSKPTTRPGDNARPLLEAMRMACSCTMVNTLTGTTSLNTEIVDDGAGIEKQGIGRNQCRDGGEDREQDEERDAASDRQQPVGLHLAVGTPENVVPALPRKLERMRGMAPAVAFLRTVKLESLVPPNCAAHRTAAPLCPQILFPHVAALGRAAAEPRTSTKQWRQY